MKFFNKVTLIVIILLFFCISEASEKIKNQNEKFENNIELQVAQKKSENLGVVKQKSSEEGLSTSNIVTIVSSSIALICMLIVAITTHKYAPMTGCTSGKKNGLNSENVHKKETDSLLRKDVTTTTTIIVTEY